VARQFAAAGFLVSHRSTLRPDSRLRVARRSRWPDRLRAERRCAGGITRPFEIVGMAENRPLSLIGDGTAGSAYVFSQSLSYHLVRLMNVSRIGKVIMGKKVPTDEEIFS
jgi:hypothetical protein